MAQSPWTHTICEDCWNEKNPERTATKMEAGASEKCCYCSEYTRSGIYIRDDPNTLRCRGEHV